MSNNKPFIITIDGPAASGKTTVSRMLAQKLNCAWVSTGAFYRGLAYVAQSLGISVHDESQLADLCLSPQWSVKLTSENTLVYFQGEDVSAFIYKEENGSAASAVSQHPAVRKNLLEAQRSFALTGQTLVAEGRDCGTVVFPQAQVKIYLVADSESRAQRRSAEQGVDLYAIKESQSKRDQLDQSRASAPLKAAPDAYYVDTSHLSPHEVVDKIYSLVIKELEL